MDLTRSGERNYVPREELNFYLQATPHIPLDGIVRDTASKIAPNGSADTLTRARAIYEWIVGSTFRDPKVSAAGPAISASCSNPEISVASVPT